MSNFYKSLPGLKPRYRRPSSGPARSARACTAKATLLTQNFRFVLHFFQKSNTFWPFFLQNVAFLPLDLHFIQFFFHIIDIFSKKATLFGFFAPKMLLSTSRQRPSERNGWRGRSDTCRSRRLEIHILSIVHPPLTHPYIAIRAGCASCRWP